jgi:hypothetical protein
MRREHASEVMRVNIFTHNGAPQALVGCLGARGLCYNPALFARLVRKGAQ